MDNIYKEPKSVGSQRLERAMDSYIIWIWQKSFNIK